MSGEYFREGSAVKLEHKPREECGVFGIYAEGEDVAAFTYNALFALQNRGHDSAGVAVMDENGSVMVTKDLGTVEAALRKGAAIKGLPNGNIATGHVRYSTNETVSAKAQFDAAQPLLGGNGRSRFALNHNGHLVNFLELRQNHPKPAECYTDSQLMTHMIQKSLESGASLYDGIVSTIKQLNGAYSMVIMGDGKLFGVRDPNGFRPLMLGHLPGGGHALASEVGALERIGVSFDREVEPGEIVEIDKEGIKSHAPFDLSEINKRLCAFELIYFSMPDNILEGELVATARRRAGIELARMFPVEADLVADAPNSGTPAARGYAYESGLPLLEALVKNNYVGRSFIDVNPGAMVDAKFNATRSIVEGQRLVVVDDSIIRGNTTRRIVEKLFNAGAEEVHLRIASAPYQWPCFYGMDTWDRSELIAAHMSVNEIRKELGATSLEYLPLRELELSFGKAAGKVCLACMSGEYPTKVDEAALRI